MHCVTAKAACKQEESFGSQRADAYLSQEGADVLQGALGFSILGSLLALGLRPCLLALPALPTAATEGVEARGHGERRWRQHGDAASTTKGEGPSPCSSAASEGGGSIGMGP